MNPYAEKLIAPDGREFTARSPAEYNDLRYGQGYRPAPEQSAEPDTQSTPESVPRADSATTPRSSGGQKAKPAVETRDA